MIADPERYANEYELDAKANIDSKRESGSVSIVAMRLWLRAAHTVVELTGPADDNGKTFGSDGNVSLWLHESDLALGNILLNRISSENAKLREQVDAAHMSRLLTENENEKLRECLQMAVKIIDVAVEKSGYNAHPDELEKMHKEMRELGIEVAE